MKVSIRDTDALRAVSPAALSAYARTEGWSLQERYRVHSDIYVGEARPEIIVPRTEHLGDYASVVATLIEIFAQVSGQDELMVYRSLVIADRDVVRVRAAESDDGSVTLDQGADLIGGARDMLLSAACSLRDPRPVYRAGANREAADLLKRVRLGQTEQGSFVVTLLMPVVPPPMPVLLPDPDDRNAPIERRMTRRLVEALSAARGAVERTAAGEEGAFGESVASGVSANLCEAMARIIEPFPTLDVGVSWARTRPMKASGTVVRFGWADTAVLREAARSFRDRAPQPDVDGTIGLAVDVDGQPRLSMTSIDTAFLRRCLDALKRALEGLRRHGSDDVLHDVFRAACVKEFERVLEQSGKLLKKRLRPWFASNRQADRLAFREVFRHAAKHGLIDAEACERWLRYRDNRNDTALDYGTGFAEATLKLLPDFLTDARALADVVEATDEAADDG